VIYDRKVNRMARPDKAAAVAELTEDFRTATATVLTEYRGLSVTLMKKLRRDLGTDTKYSVVKNTLTKIAAKDAGFDVPAELLTGPSALAFIKGDAIVAAKSLRDFAKENPFLVIKGGIYEGKTVTAAEIYKLADLESREVLLAKLAGAMKATMANAIRTIDALRIKKEEAEGPAAVAVVEAPVAVAVVDAVEEVVVEAVVDAVEEVVVEETPVVTEEVQTPVDAAVEAAEEEKE
jgi:large subunit ribosomal protein L10